MAILNYGPRARQFAFRRLEDDWRVNILEGSVRSGKTWCLHPKIINGCRYPVGGQRIITGISKQTIYNNVLSDLFSILHQRFGRQATQHYSYNRQSGELKLLGADWLVMGAKDEGSEKFVRGLTVGLAICDELTLMPQSFFQMLLSRMSPPGARLYGTTNPDNPYHWLNTDYLQNEELRRSGILRSEHFTMEDNPNLTPDYIEAQKKLYSGVFYKRFILGLWVMAQGAIYGDAWSDKVLYDDVTRPIGLLGEGGHVARVISVDYGTHNPCVFLDHYDDGHTAWCEREYRWDSAREMRQKTDREYADDMIKFIGNGTRPKIVVDPSAASFKLELQSRGLWVVDADNEVIDGIRMMAVALQNGIYRIHRHNCPGLVQEMQSYSWDDKAAKRGEEQPIKANDHGPDAGRYFVKTEIPSWRLAA